MEQLVIKFRVELLPLKTSLIMRFRILPTLTLRFMRWPKLLLLLFELLLLEVLLLASKLRRPPPLVLPELVPARSFRLASALSLFLLSLPLLFVSSRGLVRLLLLTRRVALF